jgi:hypothetical protein
MAPVPGTVIDRPATVYQASTRPEPMTQALPSNAAENTGSLTGFVLSRGRVDLPGPRSRQVVAGLLILLMIGALTVIGLGVVVALLNFVLGD